MNKLIKNLKGIITKRKKGDKAVIVELGFAVVAVILIVVFRDQIKVMIETLSTFVTTKIKEIFTTI